MSDQTVKLVNVYRGVIQLLQTHPDVLTISDDDIDAALLVAHRTWGRTVESIKTHPVSYVVAAVQHTKEGENNAG